MDEDDDLDDIIPADAIDVQLFPVDTPAEQARIRAELGKLSILTTPYAEEAFQGAATHVMYLNESHAEVWSNYIGMTPEGEPGCSVNVDPVERLSSLVATLGRILTLKGHPLASELVKRFEAPIEGHRMRLFAILGNSIAVGTLHRSAFTPIAGADGAAGVVRAALPLLLQLHGAALILDDCSAAHWLRDALALGTDELVHRVDREKLLEAIDGASFDLIAEGNFIANAPAASLPILLVQHESVWVGFLLDRQLYEGFESCCDPEPKSDFGRALRSEMN